MAASVLAVSANNLEAECAAVGEPVVAGEQPLDIAREKSAQNNGVGCAEDGKVVVEELVDYVVVVQKAPAGKPAYGLHRGESPFNLFKEFDANAEIPSPTHGYCRT